MSLRDDLITSPETQIFDAVVTRLRADPILSANFKIRAIENPTREAFGSYGIGDMAIQAAVLRENPKPSRRSTSFLAVWISAYMPPEESSEDTRSLWLDLGGYIRSILWAWAAPDKNDPAVQISFATTDFRSLTPLVGIKGATRIWTYEAVFETDVDPRIENFTA